MGAAGRVAGRAALALMLALWVAGLGLMGYAGVRVGYALRCEGRGAGWYAELPPARLGAWPLAGVGCRRMGAR